MRLIQCSLLFLGLTCTNWWYETATASQPVFLCAYRTPHGYILAVAAEDAKYVRHFTS